MFPIQDQISVVTRNHLESQLALFSNLTSKTLENFEKLVNLNITAAKATLDESAGRAQALLGAQNPQEVLSLTAAQAQPNMEKMMAYGRHLSSITSAGQAELVKVAESQFAEANRSLAKMVDDASKKAPDGVADLMKTAIDNATKGFEQMSRTTKQAAQAVEANLQASMNQLVKPAA